MADFDPQRDLPNLGGKAIVVTGGTAGLGRETVTSLVKAGSPHIFFTGRNAKSAQETTEAVKAIDRGAKVTFVECDLTDLKAVKAAAEEITSQTNRLDIVFCNAGIMATPAALSKDGFEIQFATNHLGHAMLVQQLLPLLQKTATQPKSDVRIIHNTSLGYQLASKINYDTIRTTQESYVLGAFKRYGQSKLANVLYPAEFARRYPNITSVAIHPGVIMTGLVTNLSSFNYYFTQASTYKEQVTVDEGVKNQLWAATAPKDQIKNGAFYEPVGKLGRTTPAALNQEMAKELYDWTEKTLAQY
ncbi:hypothetical protein B9Z65_8308 [Elsinoe australis]|uniref:Uncharacterized protein n=1 Tax=Elsinoe australis TaxID=40998 RepID=A0A2P7YDD6_9PEZI|nr:hypothetical protein B9Z65_8308 [Elsinoe australis]